MLIVNSLPLWHRNNIHFSILALSQALKRTLKVGKLLQCPNYTSNLQKTLHSIHQVKQYLHTLQFHLNTMFVFMSTTVHLPALKISHVYFYINYYYYRWHMSSVSIRWNYLLRYLKSKLLNFVPNSNTFSHLKYL